MNAPSATLTKQLKAARARVNAETFGTDAWESAMVVVRELVDRIDALTPPEPYRSVDGDIFDRWVRA